MLMNPPLQPLQQRQSKKSKRSGTTKSKSARKPSVPSNAYLEENAEPPPKRKRAGISAKRYMLSESLAALIGRQYATRTKVVQRVWHYIKSKGLQDSRDRRYIVCDEPLKQVTGVDSCTMFTLSRYLAPHYFAVPDTVHLPSDYESDGSDESETTTRNSRAEKTDPKKMDSKRPTKGPTHRKVTGVFTKKYKLSPELSQLVQKEYATRPQVLKKIWKHIRENELQQADDRRKITCDPLLQKICNGAEEITMFNMHTYLKPHFLPVPEGVQLAVDSDEEVWRRIDGKQSDSSDEGESSSEDEAAATLQRHPRTVRSGLTLHKYLLSDQLAEIVGKRYSTRVRGLRRLWQYVKENKLQDASDKRRVICDEKLKGLFQGHDVVTMFDVSRLLSPHFRPIPEDVDVPVDSEDEEHNAHVSRLQEVAKARAQDEERIMVEKNAEKRERKAYRKWCIRQLKKTARKIEEKEEELRRAKQRLQKGMTGLITKKYQLSPELAGIVGKQYASRGRVMKGIWRYVKEKNLQNPNDRRYVHCDAFLQSVCAGQPDVSIYTINRYISPHVSDIPEFVRVESDSEDEANRTRKEQLEAKINSIWEELEQLRQTEAEISAKAQDARLFASSSFSSAPELQGNHGKNKPEKKSKKKASKAPVRRSNFNVMKLELSDALAYVVGKKYASRSRTVKRIWEYARRQGLQAEHDRRVIRCDQRLKAVFGERDEVTMFNLGQMLRPHLQHLSEGFVPPEDSEDDVADSHPNAAETFGEEDDNIFQPASSSEVGGPVYKLSPELAAIVGKEHLSRPQVIKHLWEYFREHNLENPNDRRQVICDETLQRIFGERSLTMLSLQGLITPHLLEKYTEDSLGFDDEISNDQFESSFGFDGSGTSKRERASLTTLQPQKRRRS
eukprot:gb/GECG01011168.1/.p1 GENE.gb/GECG01011168.1/~~gb/GECG01011168.1/.p1  ORF type:complete len:897 (+),score=126.38 gb/GECG01011168.1/:1-2691(+)